MRLATLPGVPTSAEAGLPEVEAALDAPPVNDYLANRGSLMATMISEVYDAFLASGAPEDKARKAAEAIAAYDGRFNRIENDLSIIRGDINLLKWMNGITWALNLGILFKLFR